MGRPESSNEIKTKIVNEVKAKAEDTLQARRHILSILAQIKSMETQKEVALRMLIRRKQQLVGTIIEKDQWGSPKDKEQLKDELTLQEANIGQLDIQLRYLKEDLINFVKNRDFNLIEISGYYNKIEEEYRKLIK